MPLKMYYDPPNEVLEGRVGRRLQDPAENPRRFESYFAQLFEGEVMYVGIAGGLLPPQMVACVYDEDLYNQFYGYYRSGAYTFFAVYALSAADAEEA